MVEAAPLQIRSHFHCWCLLPLDLYSPLLALIIPACHPLSPLHYLLLPCAAPSSSHTTIPLLSPDDTALMLSAVLAAALLHFQIYTSSPSYEPISPSLAASKLLRYRTTQDVTSPHLRPYPYLARQCSLDPYAASPMQSNKCGFPLNSLQSIQYFNYIHYRSLVYKYVAPNLWGAQKDTVLLFRLLAMCQSLERTCIFLDLNIKCTT